MEVGFWLVVFIREFWFASERSDEIKTSKRAKFERELSEENWKQWLRIWIPNSELSEDGLLNSFFFFVGNYLWA